MGKLRPGLIGGDDGLHASVSDLIEGVKYRCRIRWRALRELRQAIAGALVGVHVDLHRKPYLQRMRGELLRIERNAHRHPLHDLDPVAGRVLSGKQGESRSGSGAKADHLAVVLHASTIDIGFERDRLATAHVGELRLLEIGIDPHLVERHDGHQRGSGAHSLPKLDGALGYKSRYRRRQRGARIGQISVAHVGGGVQHVRMVVDPCPVDPDTARFELLPRGEQRSLSAGDCITRMMLLFGRDRAGARKPVAPRQIVVGLDEVRLAHGYGRLQLRSRRKQVAHLAHRLGELRIGLVKRDFGIRLIELHQRLSGLDELRVVRADGDHGA